MQLAGVYCSKTTFIFGFLDNLLTRLNRSDCSKSAKNLLQLMESLPGIYHWTPLRADSHTCSLILHVSGRTVQYCRFCLKSDPRHMHASRHGHTNTPTFRELSNSWWLHVQRFWL